MSAPTQAPPASEGLAAPPADALPRATRPPRRTPGRDLGLDALRGLTALVIVVFHVAQGVGYNAYEDGGALTTRLKVAVPVFFTLSGYLIYRGLLRGRPREGYAAYALRRVARIVPGYWAALLVIALVPAFAEAGHRLDVLDADRSWLFFAFGQVFDPEAVTSGIPPAWTLTAELSFYALVPVVALAFAWLRPRLPGSPLRAELVLLGVAALVCIGVAQALGPARAEHPNLILTPVMNAFWFVPGMAWAAVEVLRPAPLVLRARVRVACLIGAAAVFVFLLWQLPQRPTKPFVPGHALLEYVGSGALAGLLLVACWGLRPAGGWRRLALRPLAWIGTISFGLYLWHVPFMVLFRFHGDRAWLRDHTVLPLLAQVMPAAILAGAVSWYLLEQPALKLASRPTGRRVSSSDRAVNTSPVVLHRRRT